MVSSERGKHHCSSSSRKATPAPSTRRPAPGLNFFESHSHGPRHCLVLPDKQVDEIWFVEDEISNYMVVESMLKKTNIEVYWAKNGEEAVELYRKNLKKTDIILMYIKLPKMDGLQAA